MNNHSGPISLAKSPWVGLQVYLPTQDNAISMRMPCMHGSGSTSGMPAWPCLTCHLMMRPPAGVHAAEQHDQVAAGLAGVRLPRAAGPVLLLCRLRRCHCARCGGGGCEAALYWGSARRKIGNFRMKNSRDLWWGTCWPHNCCYAFLPACCLPPGRMPARKTARQACMQ